MTAQTKSDLPQGTLDLLVLQIVALEPLHGYAIAQRLRQMSRDVVQVTQGTLYPALHRLENRGLLAADWKASDTGRDAKFYKLTRKGRAHLEAEAASWERLDRRGCRDSQCRERRGVMTWWRRLISRDRLEDQLDSELRDHFERLVAEYRQQGHADGEARRLARLEFGGLDQVKEACRDVRGTRWIDDTVQDIRHGVRGFLKTPGFTAVAVFTLALGIGANLAIFNVLDALLLRPLPVPNAPRLVTITRWIENSSSESFSYPQIRALADRPDLFASLCGIGGGTLFTGPPDALEPVGAAFVSGKYFETLGLAPFAGRLLSDGDDQPGAPPVVVITHSYWLRRFGGDASIVGRTMLLEGQQVPIVGVTPPGFEGATIGQRADVTVAIHARAKLQPEEDGGTTADQRWLLVLAVPAPELTRDQLQARLDVAWRQLLEATTPARLSADARRRALSMTVSVEDGSHWTPAACADRCACRSRWRMRWYRWCC